MATTVPAGPVHQGAPGTGLAAEYVTSQGQELLPIPQATTDPNPNPNSKQGTGY